MFSGMWRQNLGNKKKKMAASGIGNSHNCNFFFFKQVVASVFRPLVQGIVASALPLRACNFSNCKNQPRYPRQTY